MKLFDLTQTFSIHTPGWVGYPSPKLSYFQRHATHGIVSQMLELPLHSGTHFDAEFHIISGGKDMRSVPLDVLCREGVIVDVDHPERGTYSTVGCPFTLSDSPVEVKRSPLLGEHNGEILEELLDIPEGELERLTAAGAV